MKIYSKRIILALLILQAGCGNSVQDVSSFSRGVGGDLSPGYNSSLSSRYGDGTQPAGSTSRGTFKMISTSFKLRDLKSDPFDYEKSDVRVSLKTPDAILEIPAFYDGDATWRMRYTPIRQGTYSIASIKLNAQIAHETGLETKEWTVSGEQDAGFVRIDPGDKRRFVFDNGNTYFPLGHNQAWESKESGAIPTLFEKMGKAGENWSRVWMNHWDNKNLDWSSGSKKIGEIDLDVAKRWDGIVDAAGKSGIYFQLTVQHHGQYSSTSDQKFSNNNNANWQDNPYNTAKGGFLAHPEEFFSNPTARSLTKRKLRYIIARWGWSTNILAWELFNEVEGTDAGHGKLWNDIALWHREMAIFLRQQDPFHHLITTSAQYGVPSDSSIWETVDYVQTHIYATDLITAMGSAPASKFNKPSFVGEFGPANLSDGKGINLHNGLWSSLFSGAGGAAQYWDWNAVEAGDLYSHYRAVRNYLDSAGLTSRGGLTPTSLTVECDTRSPLKFAPSGGWGNAKESSFVVGESAPPAGISNYPSFLQGKGHREMTPTPLIFKVSTAKAGSCRVTVGQVSKSGGNLTLTMDGEKTSKDFPGTGQEAKPTDSVLEIALPTGAHTITLNNNGADWVTIQEIAFTNYSPVIACHSLSGKDYVAAWLFHREGITNPGQAASGTLHLPDLKPGTYSVVWTDTQTGKEVSTDRMTIQKGSGSTLKVPSIKQDIALCISKDGSENTKQAKGDRPSGK